MRISTIAAIFTAAFALSSCRTNENCTVATNPVAVKKKTYQKSSSYKKPSVANYQKPAPKKPAAPLPLPPAVLDFAAACTT